MEHSVYSGQEAQVTPLTPGLPFCSPGFSGTQYRPDPTPIRPGTRVRSERIPSLLWKLLGSSPPTSGLFTRRETERPESVISEGVLGSFYSRKDGPFRGHPHHRKTSPTVLRVVSTISGSSPRLPTEGRTARGDGVGRERFSRGPRPGCPSER